MNSQGIAAARFSPDELATVKAAAERDGMTVSAYIRAAVLREELRSRPGVRVGHTGGGETLVWTNTPELLSC